MAAARTPRNTAPQPGTAHNRAPGSSPEQQPVPHAYGLKAAMEDRIGETFGKPYLRYRLDTVESRIPTSLSGKDKDKERQKQNDLFDSRVDSLAEIRMPDGDKFTLDSVFENASKVVTHVMGETLSTIQQADQAVPGMDEAMDIVTSAVDSNRGFTKNEKLGINALRWRAAAEAAETLALTPEKGGVSPDDYPYTTLSNATYTYQEAQSSAIDELIVDLTAKYQTAMNKGNNVRAKKFVQDILDLRDYNEIFVKGTRPQQDDHSAAKRFLHINKTKTPDLQTLHAMHLQKEEDRVFARFVDKHKVAVQQKMRKALDAQEEADIKDLTDAQAAGQGHPGQQSIADLAASIGDSYASRARGMRKKQTAGRDEFDRRVEQILPHEIRLAQRKARDDGKVLDVDAYLQERLDAYTKPLGEKTGEAAKKSMRFRIANVVRGRRWDGKEYEKKWSRGLARTLRLGSAAVVGFFVVSSGGAILPVALGASYFGTRFFLSSEAKAFDALTKENSGAADSKKVADAIKNAGSIADKITAAAKMNRESREKFIEEQQKKRRNRAMGAAAITGGVITGGAILPYFGFDMAHAAANHIVDANNHLNSAIGVNQPLPTPAYTPGHDYLIR